MLSTEEFNFFNTNGFVGPFKAYSKNEAKDILRNIRIKNQNKTRILHDNEVNYDRHFDISELSTHICNKNIIEKLIGIIGENILCWRTEFFPKFPGSNGTEWHQVGNYQYANGTPMIEPTGNINIPIDLTVWTAFTDATIKNGCMKFIPGSHKKKYYDESKPVNSGRIGNYNTVDTSTGFFGYNFSEFKIDPKWDPSNEKAVSIEMQAGEFIIFTANCVHGSHPNTTTKETRFSISARYVPTHVRIYPNQKTFYSHGAVFDLKNYGAVLVSGKDHFMANRLRDKNNLDENFINYKQ